MGDCLMTARVMAAWMFAVVLAAEYVTMLMDDVHHLLLSRDSLRPWSTRRSSD
jgi:hypothetical protein